MPDISDDELASLRKGNELLDQLLRSPKTKRATERQIKALHPDTVITEDYDAPYLDEVREIGKKVDKFLEVQTTREEDGKLDAAFEKLRTDGGFTDEGLEKIKAIMVERKVADPFAAAAYYEKLNPPPQPQKPTSFAGTSWGIGAKTNDKDVELLFADEDAWAEQQAIAHFNEQAKS